MNADSNNVTIFSILGINWLTYRHFAKNDQKKPFFCKKVSKRLIYTKIKYGTMVFSWQKWPKSLKMH
jgi:hypothetical protein